MSHAEIERLEKLLAVATAVPWRLLTEREVIADDATGESNFVEVLNTYEQDNAVANAALVVEGLSAIPSLIQRIRDLEDALTPSAATKAAYIGEFSFHIELEDDEGATVPQKIMVPWGSIKEIMAAIRARALQERE
jgi:hypothetical protein